MDSPLEPLESFCIRLLTPFWPDSGSRSASTASPHLTRRHAGPSAKALAVWPIPDGAKLKFNQSKKACKTDMTPGLHILQLSYKLQYQLNHIDFIPKIHGWLSTSPSSIKPPPNLPNCRKLSAKWGSMSLWAGHWISGSLRQTAEDECKLFRSWAIAKVGHAMNSCSQKTYPHPLSNHLRWGCWNACAQWT